MVLSNFDKRKKILILDRNLSVFTKEQITKDLVGRIQTDFPGKFIILPVANKQHLEAVYKDPEERILMIYGRDDSAEFAKDKITHSIGSSIYVKSLKATKIDSLKDYAEKICEIVREYKI